MRLLKSVHVILLYAMIGGLGLLAACSKKDQSKTNNQGPAMAEDTTMHHKFAIPIEKAYKMAAWKSKGALKTDIEFTFGGHKAQGTLFVETNGPGIRLEMGKDTVGVFDGQHMWAAPSDSAVSRFQIETWTYFLKAPYKFDDPGTKIKPKGTADLNGKTYDTAKLTFKPGTGDSPKDWFILYRNQQTNRLGAMAFIVTYGKTMKQAQKHPEAITYKNFKTVEGIPVSTSWKLWHWNRQNGLSDKPIGQATLSNVQFVQTGDLFSKPEGAVTMKRPK